MIYGIAVLLMILGLLVASSALRKMISMAGIRRNSGRTTGYVMSTASAMNTGGWLMGGITANEMVNHQRPLITYQSPQGKEMSIDVVPSNFLSRRRYRAGETVDVVYDLSEPWRAYVVREWTATARDLGIGIALSAVAVSMWIVGRVYDLPF